MLDSFLAKAKPLVLSALFAAMTCAFVLALAIAAPAGALAEEATDAGAGVATLESVTITPRLNITLNGTTIEWINSHGKDEKYDGNSIEITDAEGNVLTYEDLQIKGRGNSTWLADKKPYQIKFDSKVDLFGLGKAKKWVLLANAYHPSLLRNDISFKLASALGIEGTAPGEFVDLYVDGTYLGSYYLVHKVENSSASINLKSDDGILVEIDNNYYKTEVYETIEEDGFNSYLTLKDQAGDEDDPQTAASLSRAAALYSKLLADAKAGDWDAVQADCDIESFAKFYLTQELSANYDMYCSSFYMYQDGADDVLHAAPAWDFDLSYGNNEFGAAGSGMFDPSRLWAFTTPSNELGYHAATNLFAYLNDIPEFRSLAADIYNSVLAPALDELPQYVEERVEQMGASGRANAELWGSGSFDSGVSSLMSWVTDRKEYLDFAFSGAADVQEGTARIAAAATGYYLQGDATYANVFVRAAASGAFTITRLANGFYTIGTDAGTVLSPSGLSHANGVGLTSYAYEGDNAQEWFFVQAGEGTYRIVNKVSGGVLSVVEGGGIQVRAYDPDDASQLFTFTFGECSITRYFGATALDTMSAIVDAGSFATGGVAVVATVDGYWDALAASALAGACSAPVLLTSGDELSAQTLAELEALAPSKVYIVGGTSAVSSAVETAIGALAGSVVRLAGDNAIGTAEAVSAEACALRASDTCIIATVNGYYDALSAAPIAYAQGCPIYLAQADGTLSEATLAAMKAAGCTKAVIVGGTAAVSFAAEQQLEGVGISLSMRLAGDNAWQTSTLVAEWGMSLGMSADGVGIADGNGYWDALTGAALCGARGSVLVLVPHDGSTSDGGWFAYDSYCIDNFIAKHADLIDDVVVFGGSSAVPATTVAAVRAALS